MVVIDRTTETVLERRAAEFDEQPIVDKVIDAKGSTEAHAFKFDIDRLMPEDARSHPAKAGREDGFMDGLEQSPTKIPMRST